MQRPAFLAAIFASLVLAAFVPGALARDFAMPPLVPATGMAARDEHRDERLTLAADAYDTPRKASLFHPRMLDHSVLPILIVFTNDSDRAVLLGNARFQLVTRDRAKAEPFSLDDLRRALTSVRAPGSRTEDSVPYPVPGKNSVHGGLSAQDVEQLRSASFTADRIAPHSSRQGFLFFDVTGLDDPAQGARLFVTGVTDSGDRELMYFEVPLGTALEPSRP